VKKAVLNAWADTATIRNGNRWVSRLNFECTSLPEDIIIGPVEKIPGNRFIQRIQLKGISLIMAADKIIVADGLVSCFTADNSAGFHGVDICVYMDFPAMPEIACCQTQIPCSFSLNYLRDPIVEIMSGKRIGIDPGHGGKDIGIKGPVNLQEKDVALIVALELGGLLRLSGSSPIFSRERDMDLNHHERLQMLEKANAQISIIIHASGLKHPEGRIYRVLARADCLESQSLAQSMVGSLWERMGIRVTSIKELDYYPMPAVQVEPICLSHYADEANFRSPLFQKRLGQSLFNGILRYFNT
jgi:N-acetylmuramoyl-L-alanine amidase